MGRKPSLRRRAGESESEFQMTPLLNIVMLLIPFLIMSAEFLRIGVINVVAPKIGKGKTTQKKASDTPKKPPLNLTISVTDHGFTIITRGAKVPEGCNLEAVKGGGPKKFPTIKMVGTKYNYPSLTTCLAKIKKIFSDEKRVIIMAEPEIKYSVVVAVMDGSRTSKDGKELFGEVILSAGLM